MCNLILNNKLIKTYIPDKWPIFMSEYITEIIPKKLSITTKMIEDDECFLGNEKYEISIMNWMTLVEMFIQTATLMIKNLPENKFKTIVISRLSDVSFFHEVRPKDVLRIETFMKKYKNNILQGYGIIYSSNKIIFKSKFFLASKSDDQKSFYDNNERFFKSRKVLFGYDYIRKFLKNIFPFLFIDYIESIKHENFITAIKNVSSNEWFFPNHFPNDPIMPGIFLVESILQTTTFLINMQLNKNFFPYLVKLYKIAFYSYVRPGDVLQIDVEIEKYKHSLIRAKGSIFIQDKIICKAEYLLCIKEQMLINKDMVI